MDVFESRCIYDTIVSYSATISSVDLSSYSFLQESQETFSTTINSLNQ